MGVSIDDGGGDQWLSIQTTTNAVTDVPGSTFTVPDKACDCYEIEAIAVRNNTSLPLVYHKFFTDTARINPANSFSELVSAYDAQPTKVFEHGSNATMAVALVAVASTTTVKIQVTGLTTTTIDWRIRVKRRTVTSN